MADLPTNYYDDILSASMNGKKKFRLTYRNGETEEVTIEDISEYDQYGSKFGAGDINKTNQAVNEKFDSDDVVDPMLATESGYAADAKLTGDALKEQKENLTASNGVPFKFGVNENGEYGHIVADSEGADTFRPFKDLVRDTPATALASDLTEGRTAWVNGELIVGTRPAPASRLTGTVTMPSKLEAGQNYSGNVTFDKAFDINPNVTYTKNVNSVNYAGEMSVTISNITRTGFSFKITPNLTEYHSYLGISSFTWVAQV